MRILFVTSVSSSHLTPMVPLAWGLRAAGHEVRVACDADAAPGVLALGLAAVVVNTGGGFTQRHRESVSGGSGEPYYREKETLPRMFAENALAMLDGLMTVADRWRPHAVVYEPVAFAAEVVAAARRIPALRHLWGPDVFGTPHGMWLRQRVHELLADASAKYGGAHPNASREFVVDPCPAPMQKLGAGTPVPIRYVPVDRPGTVPDWLLGPPPRDRICVTWGTFADGTPTEHPLMRALRRLADLDIEVLLAAQPADIERLGDLPGRVRTVTGAPMHAVLPSCTAIVHHGGANTVLGAVSRGIPQLVVSDSFERALNGGRLAGTGAGLHLSAEDADPYTVETAVRRLVTDAGLAGAAATLRKQTLDRPAPAQVAGDFEQLVAAQAAATSSNRATSSN
jgi:UDP:flavonoid glycosyltransferase YjiC (YdhE family)